MKYINDSTGLSSEDVTVQSRKNNVSKWNSVFIHFHFTPVLLLVFHGNHTFILQKCFRRYEGVMNKIQPICSITHNSHFSVLNIKLHAIKITR